MYTLLVLYPPPLSKDDFRRYYVDAHLPLAAQLPGLRSSSHVFEPQGVGSASPYFCIWQGQFDSADALDAAMQSEIGQRVAADTANYASGGVHVLRYGATAGRIAH
ncbi:EthD family reductase (plasmid) [Paraburkholderia sp. PREW-6R]|uniref:EthD family reductase n=1 Tax=Paraburkholderia sp. PREW-6R TaxID=3141544 RepID=UPI0031F51322